MDKYVVVTEFDTDSEEFGPKRGPLVFEQYIDDDNGTLDQMRERAKALSVRYGKCRIARLEFVE